jgi:hypothetical protein
MSAFPTRDLAFERSRHFRDTAEERFFLALRLGREALELYLAGLPPNTSTAEARDRLRRNKHRGRRPSALMEARRA